MRGPSGRLSAPDCADTPRGADQGRSPSWGARQLWGPLRPPDREKLLLGPPAEPGWELRREAAGEKGPTRWAPWAACTGVGTGPCRGRDLGLVLGLPEEILGIQDARFDVFARAVKQHQSDPGFQLLHVGIGRVGDLEQPFSRRLIHERAGI